MYIKPFITQYLQPGVFHQSSCEVSHVNFGKGIETEVQVVQTRVPLQCLPDDLKIQDRAVREIEMSDIGKSLREKLQQNSAW